MIGNCFGPDGIEEIRGVLENTSFLNQMVFSDDEGSDDEEEEEGDGDEYDEKDEEEGEENDEDYEDYEDEEGEEETESPSFFFGSNNNTNPIQQQAWNNFQFGFNNKLNISQQESIGGLSSMIAGFGLQVILTKQKQENFNDFFAFIFVEQRK